MLGGQGLGFRVWDLGSGVSGLGFGVWGLGSWGVGELGSWGVGELGSWGVGELGSWGVGELGSWGVGELGFGAWGARAQGLKPLLVSSLSGHLKSRTAAGLAQRIKSLETPIPLNQGAFLELC